MASSFEDIMESMLENVPSDLDTREGSLIWTVLAPAAYELSKAYFVLENVMNLMLPDTSEGTYLDRLVTMFGVTRKPATNAIRKLETFNVNDEPFAVPIGSRFRIDDISVITTEVISAGVYRAEVEQSGVQGNLYVGNILPVSNIDGLARAYLSDVLIMAQDEETDDDLKTRFFAHVSQQTFAGNIPDYIERTNAIDGVGATAVVPIWNGAGTVLLIVGDEDQRSASQELVQTVQDYYMPVTGDGMAPIGHTVTVATSTPLNIAVAAELTLEAGASFAIVGPQVEQAISDYVASIKFTDSLLYIARLTAVMLDVDGVLDVANVTINGNAANLEFSKTAALYQTPGTLTCTLTEA